MEIRDEDEAYAVLERSMHRVKSANRMDKLVQAELVALNEVLQFLVGQRSSERSYRREMQER